MKLADSLNPATQAENIKKLNAGLEAVDAKTLPGTSTATTGQILKLTGETKTPAWADEYTPPAYSETETATGQKWINGRDIYTRVFYGTLPEITSSMNFDIENVSGIKDILLFSFITTNPSYSSRLMTNTIGYIFSDSLLRIYNLTSSYSSNNYSLIVYYTKPDPTPGRAPEDEPEEVKEPEVKKTTKKKTTK